MKNTKNYKQLTAMIAEVKTSRAANETGAEIDKSFSADVITWNDHETLWALLGRIWPHDKKTQYKNAVAMLNELVEAHFDIVAYANE